ncbi:MAG: glycosyltransferase [Holosporaceae bacterium]|jgi:glycosyltransferase involved in cell wall biosynthesis|nr:glycosyltransferase [Holosporaceae bacterium]
MYTGPGPARNRGLTEARGEFIWFVDADDEVPTENFRDFDIKQACQNCDVVMFRYNQVIPGVKGTQPWEKYDDKVMATRPADDFTVAEFPDVLITLLSVWNKFFRREIIETSGMNFPDCAIYEDVTFTIINLCAAKNIRFVNRELYTYHRNNSHLSLANDERRMLIFPAMQICENWLKRNCINRDIWTLFHVCKIRCILFSYMQTNELVRCQIKQYFDDYLRSLDQDTFVRLLRHPFLNIKVKQRMLELQNFAYSRIECDDSHKYWLQTYHDRKKSQMAFCILTLFSTDYLIHSRFLDFFYQ